MNLRCLQDGEYLTPDGPWSTILATRERLPPVPACPFAFRLPAREESINQVCNVAVAVLSQPCAGEIFGRPLVTYLGFNDSPNVKSISQSASTIQISASPLTAWIMLWTNNALKNHLTFFASSSPLESPWSLAG